MILGTSKNKNYNFLIIFLIIITAIIPRLYHITYPPADNHSFRQTDTYAIALNFLEENTSILYPKMNHATDWENADRYYFAEFPIYEYFLSLIFKFFTETYIYARLINICFSVVISLTIFFLFKKLFSKTSALIASIVYNLFPLSIFWGRAITPEIFGLMNLMLSIVIIADGKNLTRIFLSSFFFTLAILTKPFHFLFFILIVYCLKKSSSVTFFNLVKRCIIFLTLPLFAFLGWRLWALTFPAPVRTDPDISWLLHQDMGYWAFWRQTGWPYKLIQDYFFGLLFTAFGGILALSGIILVNIKKLKHSEFLNLWIIISLLISLIVSAGSKIHDYYLLYWLPLGSILIGITLENFFYFLTKIPFYKSVIYISVVIISFYLLGLIPFLNHINSLFEVDTNLAHPVYIKDYQTIKTLVLCEEEILTIQKNYHPYAINFLRRKGFIWVIDSREKKCPIEKEFLEEQINGLKVEYILLLEKNEYFKEVCLEVQTILDKSYDIIYKGEESSLYKVIKQ